MQKKRAAEPATVKKVAGQANTVVNFNTGPDGGAMTVKEVQSFFFLLHVDS